MECNKDEAIKAKVFAEQMLTENDFASAKKFALKAQALYPGTEGLIQLLMTINVYISAEKKVSSSIGGLEIDWYGVLGVTPISDDETIKKEYRKLALIIHPDKNKCVGADGAFKLVLEAWSLLSDKAKRFAYDQRIGFLNKNASSSSSWSDGFCFKRPVNFKTISPHVISSDPMFIIKWNLAARLTNEWEKANKERMKKEEVCDTKKRMARKKRVTPGPRSDHFNPFVWFILSLRCFPPAVSASIAKNEKADEERMKRAQEEKQTVSGTKKRKANKDREDDTFKYWTTYQRKKKFWTTSSPSGEPILWCISS